MNALRSLSVDGQVALLFVVLFGVLVLLSLAVLVRSLRASEQTLDEATHDRQQRLLRDLRAMWVGATVFWLAWVSGPVGATLAFGLFSFFALREFITLVKTRPGDHRSLLLAFFGVLLLHYALLGWRCFDLFSVFIPVYLFLALPVVSAPARWAGT